MGTRSGLTSVHPRRVAMLSMHTSPLDQPGTGDAGGMNVYVVALARELAARGVAVDVFTRARARGLPPRVELCPGVVVRNISAGPYEDLDKAELPAQLCAFAAGVLRAEADHEAGWYDLVHSHYWLSGQVGWLAAERWGVPLVHTAHTLGKVKNAALAAGDSPEPRGRLIGEDQVVRAADRLIASTPQEVDELVRLYHADPARIACVPPGVDLSVFHPGRGRGCASSALTPPATSPPDPDGRVRLLFAGRLQPLKAPDLLVRATAELLSIRPDLRQRLEVLIVGGPSGSAGATPEALAGLAAELELTDIVRFEPPVPHTRLAELYRSAWAVVVPSHNESFGLVALEAQACGTPVVATRVGGLCTAVDDGRTGVLVSGHSPRAWAEALAGLVDPGRRVRMGRAAAAWARRFGWPETAAGVLTAYRAAVRERMSGGLARAAGS